MISIRAKGVLFELVSEGATLSAESLAEKFKEGRDAMRTALSELEDAGYIRRFREKINGRIINATVVTEAGYDYLLGTGFWRRLFRQQIQLPEQLAYTPYDLSISLQTSGNPTKEEDVPYEFFERTSSEDDDNLKRKVAYVAAQKEARRQAKLDRQNNPKVVTRHMVPKTDWSCADSGMEFKERLEQHWNIDPFSMMSSHLVPSISKFRKRLDTDGEIECKMMDYFFSRIQMDKYTDPNLLVNMFIKQADELYGMATAGMVSEEVKEMEQTLTDKSWDWMEDNVSN